MIISRIRRISLRAAWNCCCSAAIVGSAESGVAGWFAVEEAREDIGELCLILDQLWARFVIHLLR
jgi:hypothetical protein